MSQIKLNLGCGNQIARGWINVDYSLGGMLAKIPLFFTLNKRFKFFNLSWSSEILIHDLTKTFPWSNETVDEIYSSHTLEHLNKNQGRHFLKECHRVLKKDGIIRIVVPDLNSFVHSYLNGEILAEDFIEKLRVLNDNSQKSYFKNKLAVFTQSLHSHKCMYDTQGLMRITSSIGFACQSKKPFESDISDIKTIELEDRTIEAVIVEGKKG